MILVRQVGYLLTHSLTHSLYGAEYYLKSWFATQLIKKYPAFFIEPEDSQPYSQKPTTGPYPEPAESG
jgi:hypothetical protein